MKDYLITTFDGKEELRSKCVRQNQKFYKINKDIVKVNCGYSKVWLLKSNNNLLFNIDTSEYVHYTNKAKYIIYDIDEQLTTNEFDCNLYEAYIEGIYLLCTPEYANKHLKLDEISGIYYKNLKPKINNSIFYKNLNYSYEHSKSLFNNFKESKQDVKLNKLLSKYSFGVELETSTGAVPANKLLKLGVLPVRDGSTHNYEYVTKPLTQLTNLIPIVEALNKHCTFDISTSMHIHLGNVPTDKEFILNFYKFIVNMQPQIYKMFPKYKLHNDFNIKKKNYTQALTKKIKFETILNFLNNNKQCTQEYTGEMLNHNDDVERLRKWQLHSRYYWCNLIPLIFYPSRTIEFRIHQGTFNKYKIIYWLLICAALIKYVEKTGLTSEIPMKQLFKEVYPENSVNKALTFHYNDMVKYYTKYDEGNDVRYERDVIDDYRYAPRVKLF